MPSLDAIGIVVADIEKAVAFYTLIGLPQPEDMEGPHVESVLPSGLRVMFDTEELIKQLDPSWSRPATQSMALAFKCDSPAEVDAAHAKAIAAGYASAAEPWDAFWGQRYAQVYDPDGNKVDLFAAL